MLPYFLIYSLVLSSSWLGLLNESYEDTALNKKLKTVLDPKRVFFIVFLFAALRGNGNGDYFNYLAGVSPVSSLKFLFFPKHYPFEFGFRVLSYLVNFLNLNPQFVLIGMNAISFLSIYYVVDRLKLDLSISLFAFFPIVLLYDMHHSRSAVAMSLGMVFFLKLWEYDLKEWWKAFIYFLIGFSFHKSMIVLLLMIPIVYYYKYRHDINKYKMKKDFKFSFLIFLLMFFIVMFVNPIQLSINILNNSLTSYFYIKLNSYLANPKWSYPFKLYDPRLIATVIFYFSFYILEKEKNLQKEQEKFYLSIHKVYFLSLLLLLLFSESTMLTLRIYHLFNIIVVVYFPRLLKFNMLDDPHQRRLKYFLVFIYTVYTIAIITQQVPYKLCFFMND